MKHIDAEKLIAEIDRMEKSIENATGDYAEGRRFEQRHIRFFITSLQQEQPKSKLVKVRCVFPFDETWEKNKIYTCKVWHHGDLNRNFWDVYYDYGKDPKYVQFPTIELLNEEFAIIQEESQVIPELPEADLDFQVFAKEMDAVFNLPIEVTENTEENPLNWEYAIARHFYELGLNARKED